MTTVLRSRLRSSVLLSAAWLALLGATHCGGESSSVAGASAGNTGSAGSSTAGAVGTAGACHGPPLSTPVGRPQAVACPATAVGAPVAGSGSCNVDADCSDGGFGLRCFRGTCGVDECLTDADCPSGSACRCSSELRGNAAGGNSCVPAACRVDADCGPAGVCSPDTSGHCGSLVGYRCHSAADSCHSDADCCGNTAQCGYQPELGYWACAALTVCNG